MPAGVVRNKYAVLTTFNKSEFCMPGKIWNDDMGVFRRRPRRVPQKSDAVFHDSRDICFPWGIIFVIILTALVAAPVSFIVRQIRRPERKRKKYTSGS